ncbi:gliding motility-associated ABC transporter ATP-binding subunit GldA [Adhaeribacter radiodurans]|uniref:Gliding motility-associated ABC transporter ATP-binding subunit GldA n=1 Tax=Adhaeribacter radiodurans TaxID=2745197 RepID=A0A7L7L8E7_9BACT|nr:gliding motility-associated ABC transporter ATP-binding subunit GldA [Adhaeribacter radiodurans]QMU29004.1 gliding motility-associated ABC transporter ATP-binding subunit GldA [Adhaeribacter radiodurans]
MSVEVKNLTKLFGAQRAVDNISFRVNPGQVLGFLGPNGAGKSTTMKIATGYLPPSAGTITINGYDVQETPLEVRRHVGYLPEHNPLYLDMYVSEYLVFIGQLYGLKGNELNKRVQQMIALCGLMAERHKKIGSLSKGYRQRVGLAQALLHDPQVLILDEPTTGLDPNQITEIRTLIKQVGQEKTVLFSTHIMQEVSAICDRVVIINKGKIVADSDVSSLTKINREEVITVVDFESPIEVSLLHQIPGILEVEQAANYTYRLKAKKNIDIRSAVFALAAEHKWSLIGLRQEEQSLEKIFQSLTK